MNSSRSNKLGKININPSKKQQKKSSGSSTSAKAATPTEQQEQNQQHICELNQAIPSGAELTLNRRI
ncbi:hypothetical protein SK128_015587 [Halocaridina rubra]|uniref:Uncharacterized protein n=1 Tax=Halocaridina rubra TaxID=373956 RepID=A0AAN8WRM1_HALRR